jgi:hypothetical protein
MAGGADTSIGQGNCIFVGLNVFRQLFNVVGRKVLVRNQSHRNVDDQADWLEIFKRIVPGVFIQRGCGGEARMHQQYRVAVSVGAGDLSGTDSAAGPAFIFDDDRFSQRGPHGFGQGARHVIGWAPRREGHYHIDWAIRESGMGCGADQKGSKAQNGSQFARGKHHRVSE